MDKLKVTIKDILHRQLFRNAHLIAGKEGTDREIKWTHILEMNAFDAFINGGELILTTGSNIDFGSAAGLEKIKTLLKNDVAGICVELGTYVKEIDPAIIDFANKNAFPIVVFEKTVKFVDITQDLHTIIINSHHEQLHHLHTLSNEFNERSLEPNGILKILTILYKHFDTPMLLITEEKKLYYYPLKYKEKVEYIYTLIDQEHEEASYKDQILDGKYYTNFPIRGLGQKWGSLYIQAKADELDEFSFSILDRAALALAQILLRKRTITERKQNQEEELVQKLIHGEPAEPSIKAKILPPPAENLYYRLIVIENKTTKNPNREEDWEEIKLQQAIILRSIFKRHGFFPAISVTKRNIVVIASFYKSQQPAEKTNSFVDVTEVIRKLHEENIFDGENVHIAASSLQKDYGILQNCLTETDAVLSVQKLNILDVVFYEELGVYYILNKFSKEELTTYVDNHLGPLLKLDQKTKNDLLLTLSVYLETMGSKKETSKRLFIVRQTLYHRLEKLKDLLGENFMEPMNRQAIELAISAYKLLHGDALTGRKSIYTP